MPREFPFDVDPALTVFVQRIVLAASEEKDMPLVSARVIAVSKMLAFGTGAGDVSIALGERGDFFDLSPGDLLRARRFSQVRFRNNTGVQKTFEFLHTSDPDFTLENYERGL